MALSLPTLDRDHTIWCLEHMISCVPGRTILLLWERAPWHQGRARRFVETPPPLDRLYFPPGCPDLNPQAPVWHQPPRAVGHLWDYRHLGDLRQAFQAHRNNTLFRFDWIATYLPAISYASVFL